MVGLSQSGSVDQVRSDPEQQSQSGKNRSSMARAGIDVSGIDPSANVEALRQRVYGPSDLSRYRARDRFVIRAADLSLYAASRMICSTLKWEVQGGKHLDAILATGDQPIFVFWHSCMINAIWFFRNRGIVVMSSISRDGEYTGRVIKRFGYGTARGSATRGGGRALVEMAACLENGIPVAFTIDGPRGPAFVAKPGSVTLARHTGHAILPFHIATKSYYAIQSWDRMQIPLPFSRSVVCFAEPIYVARSLKGDELAGKHAAVQAALDQARRDGEHWRVRAHDA
jgi:lysophospholipid acyltransferase (LPLAT)-like uncharacterized protein